MRKLSLAISTALLASIVIGVACAQIETVTVTAESMSGIWKIGLPVWGPYRQGMSASWGPIHDLYCRLEGPTEHLRVYCPHMEGAGNVTLDGNKIHIAWGTMTARTAIDATEETPGVFTGSYVVKIAGYVLHAPGQLTARKIAQSEDVPDSAGKSALLAELLNHTSAGARAQSPQNVVPEDGVRLLGPVKSVSYLGRTPTSAEWARGQYAHQLLGGREPAQVTRSCGRFSVTTGVVPGVLMTISSVGAGALGVTALLLLDPELPAVRLVGNDIAHAAPLTLVVGLDHLASGDIDLAVLVSLLIQAKYDLA